MGASVRGTMRWIGEGIAGGENAKEDTDRL